MPEVNLPKDLFPKAAPPSSGVLGGPADDGPPPVPSQPVFPSDEAAKETAEAPPPPKPVFTTATKGPKQLYPVHLADKWNSCPGAVIAATDRLDAVDGYKAYNGITYTEHEIKVGDSLGDAPAE